MRISILVALFGACTGYTAKDDSSPSVTDTDTDTDTDSDSDSDSDADSDSDSDTDTPGVDKDGAGYTEAEGDCDDSNPDVNPRAPELCGDGLDNNCNGRQDERSAQDAKIYCPDRDEDSLGDPYQAYRSCVGEKFDVENCDDCDDTDASVGACPFGGDDKSVCTSTVGIPDGLVPPYRGVCDTTLGFQEYGGHCYYSVPAKHVTWRDARVSCIVASMHLVTFTDANEQSFIGTLQPTTPIGACDEDKEGLWPWLTHEPSGPYDWAKGQPDNGGTFVDCAFLEGGQWADEGCGNDRMKTTGYVCEADAITETAR